MNIDDTFKRIFYEMIGEEKNKKQTWYVRKEVLIASGCRYGHDRIQGF